jgi:hypothetical protein
MQKKYFNSQDARNLIQVYDFAIFPIHGIKEDGECTCNNLACTSKGKHPATPDGFKSASKDIEKIKQMWAGRVGLNVGIATGATSGFFAVDCDSQEAFDELNSLITLPKTLTVKTGRGYHLYFKCDPTNIIKNGTNLRKNIDLKTDGGYVAGIGSVHANGTVYKFINPLEEIAAAPQELYDLLKKEKIEPNLNFEEPPKRKLFFTSEGWSEAQIEQHLSHINPDCDYDTWVKVGMALHQEGVSFHVFDNWSRRGNKYDGSTGAKWKSFHKGGGISYGTVVALAQQGGWKHERAARSEGAKQEYSNKEGFNEETGETKEQPSTLYYIPAKDIKINLEDKTLIKDVIGQQELSVIYGESNCGKTFFMTDLSMHIARGINWRDKRVSPGGVMYAALEGARGMSGRFVAYCTKHNIENPNFPFAIMPCGLDFYSEKSNINEFIDMIKRSQDDIGDPKLIVIDTLARAMAGGDENSGQDMGKLVYYSDIIRAETKAHLSFIHHSGKNKALGARGHSSLRAAVDTEIEISRDDDDDYSSIRFVKQREMEIIEPMYFSLEKVAIGQNGFMEEITSCVVNPYEKEEGGAKKAHLTAEESFVLEAITNAINKHGFMKQPYKDGPQLKCVTFVILADVLEEMGYGKMFNKDGEQTALQKTKGLRVKLRDKNLIGFNAGFVWLLSY